MKRSPEVEYEWPNPSIGEHSNWHKLEGYEKAKQDMLNANYVKVVEK